MSLWNFLTRVVTVSQQSAGEAARVSEARAGDDVSSYLQCLHDPPHSAVCAAVIMFVAATISHPSLNCLQCGSIVAL